MKLQPLALPQNVSYQLKHWLQELSAVSVYYVKKTNEDWLWFISGLAFPGCYSQLLFPPQGRYCCSGYKCSPLACFRSLHPWDCLSAYRWQWADRVYSVLSRWVKLLASGGVAVRGYLFVFSICIFKLHSSAATHTKISCHAWKFIFRAMNIQLLLSFLNLIVLLCSIIIALKKNMINA